MRKILFITVTFAGTIAIGLGIGCSQDEDRGFFDGSVVTVDIPERIEYLQGTEFVLNGLYTGYMAVYDTLAFFFSPKYKDYFFAVFNLQNHDYIRNFCIAGRGPDEFLLPTSIRQFYWDKDELKTILYDVHKKSLLICNISKVVRGEMHYIERNIPLIAKDSLTLFNMVFKLDKDAVMARAMEYLLDDNTSSPPQYLIKRFEEEEEDQYSFFKKSITKGIGSSFGMSPGFCFLSFDALKPSGDKLVSAMALLSQVNIIDISTKQKKGIRLKGTPTFKYLTEDTKPVLLYYTNVVTSDDFIYALWCNRKFDPTQGLVSFAGNIIHVFDWEGRFVRVLNLDHTVDQIVLDQKSKTLYAKIDADDTLFCYGKIE